MALRSTRRTWLTACVVPSLAVASLAQQYGWMPIASPSPPPAAYDPCFAFDSVRDLCVLADDFGKTWMWNGAGWTQPPPGIEPTDLWGAEMAFDAQRGRCVRFGGLTTIGGPHVLAETWEFDGAMWVHRLPAVSPPARCKAGLAYDSARGRTVLFGGTNDPYMATAFDDTWEWDGTQWLNVTPAVSPPARAWAFLAYDSTRARTVLFGGGAAAPFADTWEWDGVAWHEMTTAVAPPRTRFAMAFNRARNTTMVFGGFDNTGQLADTLEWNGATWSPAPTLAAPSPREGSVMAFDAARDRMVMFGGYGSGMLAEIWEYGALGVASYLTFGNGCAGTLGTPVLTAGANRPVLGQPFSFTLSNLPPDHSTLIAFGWSNTQWLGTPLPLHLAAIGFPGCHLRASPDIVHAAFNWSGTVVTTIDIPNQSNLVGMRFFNQGAVIDGNGVDLLFSNGGVATLGQ